MRRASRFRVLPPRHALALRRAGGEVRSGDGQDRSPHASRDFIGFLRKVIASCPSDQEIHIILDNLSAHKTQTVREFLEQNPRVRFHFTPTYSSWLNQVEIWFAKIERDVIARGIFTSAPTSLASFAATSTPIQPTHGYPMEILRHFPSYPQ
jgi:hypothetical protein